MNIFSVMEAKYIPTSMDALIRFLYSVYLFIVIHLDSCLTRSFLPQTGVSEDELY